MNLNRISYFHIWECVTDTKEKIIKETLDWYKEKDDNPNVEELIDLVINKTAESFIKHLQTEFEEEFTKGNLKHPFFISNEYYLELKLKDVKNKYLQTMKFSDSV
jgi:dissimilatory sulfite reductase (desulfoviridin) alpha/beta subunit